MSRRDWTTDPLEALRSAEEPSPPPGAQERVASRLAASMAGVPVGQGPELPTEVSGGATLRTLAGRFARWSLLPLGVGVVVGAAARHVTSHESRSPALLRSMPLASATPAAAPSVAVPMGSAALAPAVTSSAATAAESPRRRVGSLGAERAVLDRARKKLGRGEGESTLTLLDEHARRFAGGALTEEREAMRVRALALLGRLDEARAVGAAFRARYPDSLMMPAVDAAVPAVDAR
jgi:hypothetical protein